MKKKVVYYFAAIVFVIIAASVVWNTWFSATKVGFLNYQVINLGQIGKANTNSFINIKEISPEELDEIKSLDMLFINGMGLRITAEQRDFIQTAADNGLPVLTTAATNPANKIISVDSIAADTLTKYLGNAGRKNYRSALNYVRQHIDGKSAWIDEIAPVLEKSDDMFYHADPKNAEEEELSFSTVAKYQDFLREQNLWKEGAPSIIIAGAMGEPTGLIAKLEETGNNVYPVRDFTTLMALHLVDSIQPAAIINMAHGRMGDEVVNYLTQQNIPLFAPLNVNRLVDEWEADKMGMSGGFLSQSVVTPEIDGAIRSYALFGHYLDEEGLQQAYTIPERNEVFVSTLNKYLKLKQMPNSEKKVAIYYLKGAGQSALTAAGMEVVPSLYNLLKRLKAEGYTVKNIPASPKALEEKIQREGKVFGTYAEGASIKYMKDGFGKSVNKEQYEGWVKQTLRPEKYQEVLDLHGEFPGQYMVNDAGELTVPCLDFGNVVLLPQPAAGGGDDAFKIVHGTDQAPPHIYLASYLWVQNEFKADALIHFGTHGSLEFTPKKQVALSHNDWADRLVGDLPHFYVYSIGNVGEGMIAKRRSYAGLQSYLTPPFMESSVRGIYRELSEAIKIYNNKVADGTPAELDKLSLKVKALTVKMGIHRELRMDSTLTQPYTEAEIARIENFAEEIATEKITGQLYTMGTPYEPARINSSVFAMATEPIAYSLLALDKLNGKATADVEKRKALFTQRYLNPARDLVKQLLAQKHPANDEMICRIAKISMEDLQRARHIDSVRTAPKGMAAMMAMAAKMKAQAAVAKREGRQTGMPAGHPKMEGAAEMPAGHPKAEKTEKKSEESAMMKMMHAMKDMGMKMPEGHKKMMSEGKKPSKEAMQKMQAAMEKQGQGDGMKKMMAAMMGGQPENFSKDDINFSMAVREIERTIKNVNNYRNALLNSPENELGSLVNALNGGYTAPSPGGDPIANPNTIPTGRNLYAINAEATPSESAWDKGVQLANNTIKMYRERHNDSIPRKVSYTLWSGEFIETEGATIAQILYMLGVEPIRDAFGRVNDIRLIPSKELGRPRIDVVVQTSGQLRDLAASRLFLVHRAVEMAAAATDDEYENQVAAGVVEAERVLIEKGLSPKEAREISTYRVFGGANGNYGTGIQGMVMAGDRWDSEKQIAETYLNNMGTFYGDEKQWETMRNYAFEAALTRTDAVIQPRQSNTWGALSLDHVYEFMGGLNLAVRNVTGKDPDAYLSDYRNRNNVKMQEVKEAIGVESRTTIFNPTYIQEKMKGEASSANTFAEVIQNTYAWNVMKPEAIDTEMWDEIYNVYVKDKFNLKVDKYFEEVNPAALQEITAVMMETARKGMWKASEQQLKDVAAMHTELVKKYKPACTGFVCDNAKLREFIAEKTAPEAAQQYKKDISEIREAVAENSDKKGMVMKKEKLTQDAQKETSHLSNIVVAVIAIAVLVILILLVRKRRKQDN